MRERHRSERTDLFVQIDSIRPSTAWIPSLTMWSKLTASNRTSLIPVIKIPVTSDATASAVQSMVRLGAEIGQIISGRKTVAMALEQSRADSRVLFRALQPIRIALYMALLRPFFLSARASDDLEAVGYTRGR
jgi:hypothetical protein